MIGIEIATGKGGERKLRKILSRWQQPSGQIEERVRFILEEVCQRGDKAVLEFTREYDGVDLQASKLRASQEEIDGAYREVDPAFLTALREAVANITRFHQRQKEESWFIDGGDGAVLGQKVSAIESVGLYVPGGKASYPSTVLMGAVPARVAGVQNLTMVTPPGGDEKVDEAVLVAAREVGVEDIYRVGGAQAIAALAFGTETIPKVDKIVGPGNIYVTVAKKLVYGLVDVDMIAGPSEVVILADEGADPAYVAADLLAQAEHSRMAWPILITPVERLAWQVRDKLELQSRNLDRVDIIESSLTDNGAIFLVEDIEEGVSLINRIAPEHVELMVTDPWDVSKKIRNAGAIFMGAYSPVAVGDYFVGPNHILPTGGAARFCSPLGVNDFTKRTNVVFYTKEKLQKAKDKISMLAQVEGLTGHVNSIELRDG